MPTILYLNLYTAIGGGERALIELLGALDRERFQPLVVVPRPGPLVDALRARGVEVRVLAFPTPPLYGLLAPPAAFHIVRAAWRLRALARERGVRVLHCGDLLAVLMALAARPRQARVVFQANYIGGFLRRALLRLLAGGGIDTIVAYSQGQHARLTPGRVRARAVVVPPGIDAEAFAGGDRRVLRRELELDEETPLVGLVARYDVWKGHGVLLDAAARVHAVRSDVRFVIAGGALNADSLPHVARYREGVMARRRALGLEGIVLAVDHREDVASLLAALDVVVCPSFDEPFGMVVIEALAAGRAVVASDSGGPAEIIEDGASGVLFETGSGEALAARLLELVGDARRRQALGAAGQARVRQAFTARRYAADMEALYAALA